MDLAIEDATPLFDLVHVVAKSHGSIGTAEALDIARRCVRQLLDVGHIEVVRDCLRPLSGSGREFIKLSIADATREIEDDANWEYHPRGGASEEWIAVGATQRGERAHYAGLFM